MAYEPFNRERKDFKSETHAGHEVKPNWPS
jgi:hypothetical protein